MVLIDLLRPWTWKMAWRDSRRSRARLILFSTAIMFGIAALTAIGSLKQNLIDSVDDQAKALVGSDAFINVRGNAFSKELDDLLKSSRAVVSRESSGLALMEFASRPEQPLERVEARGVESTFPFYGQPTTVPPEAWARCLKGEGVVADANLLEKTGAKIGDVIKIGKVETKILGTFTRAPARASWAGALGVFAPEIFYARTLALQSATTSGAFSTQRAHLQFPKGSDPEQWVRPNRELLKKLGAEIETVEKRRKGISSVLEGFYSFLSLLGFISLVLGGLGVASAIHVHSMQRLPTVAILRCIGCKASRAFAVYLAQGICLGFIGAVGGVLLGLALQQGLPALFRESIPIEVNVAVHAESIWLALGMGFLVCVSFAMLPLLKIRRVSPLAAVRASISEETKPGNSGRWLLAILWAAAFAGWIWLGRLPDFRDFNQHIYYFTLVSLILIGAGLLVKISDPYAWIILATLGGTLTLLAASLGPPKNPAAGYAFAAGIAIALLILAVASKMVVFTARKLARFGWPHPLRQGLLNLHRPRNQTMLVFLSAGLGVSLILTMVLVQRLLLEFFESKALRGKPNLYIAEVRGEQRSTVEALLAEAGAPPPEFIPRVIMKLRRVKNVDVEVLQKSEATKLENWIVNGEHRTSYRSGPGKSERVVAGEFSGHYAGGPWPVSVEKGMAARLKVGLGDSLTFSVSGKPYDAVVTSLREIEWQELEPNFFFVFADGALAEFPQVGVYAARLDDAGAAADIQRTLAAQFSNIQVFDVGEIISAVGSIMDEVSFVVRTMGLFTILTGIVILVAVIISGKRDRVQESVLLRTLGASKKQIWKILASEYALLGLLSALAGTLLSSGAAWWLARNLFKIEFQSWWVPGAIALAAMTLFTMGVGLLLSRGVVSQSPLSILREEG